MRLKDCYDKGLLRKRRPDLGKCERAVELAKKDLERAHIFGEDEGTLAFHPVKNGDLWAIEDMLRA